MSTEQENAVEADKEAAEEENTEAGSGTEGEGEETAEPDLADTVAEPGREAVEEGEDNVGEETEACTVTDAVDNGQEADKDTGDDMVDDVAEVEEATSEQADNVLEESGADEESGDMEGKMIETNKETEAVEENTEAAVEGETEQTVDDEDQEMETDNAEADVEEQELETGDGEDQEMQTGDAEDQGMQTGDAEDQGMQTGDAEDVQDEEEEEEEETEEDKAAGHLCKVCDIRFETYNEFFSHSRGMIHTQKVISTKDENWEDELKDKGYDQWANVKFGCFPDQVKKSVSKRRPYYCSICKVQLSSERQFNDHVDGKKHIKLAEEMANLGLKTEGESGEVMRFMSSSEMKDAAYYCRLCFVQCSGEVPYRDHVTGKSHLKKKAEADKEGGDDVPADGTIRPPEGLVRCDATNAVIQKKLDKSTEPIAGEEHVIEILSADWAELRYYCYMCEIYINQATIYHHIIGMKHRLNFIKQKDHAKHQEISAMKRRSDKSAAITEYLKMADSPIPRKVKVYHDPEDTTALMNFTGGEDNTERSDHKSPARKRKAESPIRRNDRRRRSRSRDRSGARRDRRDRNRSHSREMQGGRGRWGGRGDRGRRSRSNSLDRLRNRRDRRRRSRSDSLERWSDRRERDRGRRSRSGSFDNSIWGRGRYGRSRSRTRGDSPYGRADSDRYGRRDPYDYRQDRDQAPYSYPGSTAPPSGFGGGYSSYDSGVGRYPDYGSHGADPYYRHPAEGARPDVGARAAPYSTGPPAPVPPHSVPGYPVASPASGIATKAPSELELLFKSMFDTVQRDNSAATVALSLSTALTQALLKRQGSQLTAEDLASPEIQQLLAAAGAASKPQASPSDSILDQIRKSMVPSARQPEPSAPRAAVPEVPGSADGTYSYRAPPSRSVPTAGSHRTSGVSGHVSYPMSKQGALGGGYGMSSGRTGGNNYGSSSQQQRAGGGYSTSPGAGYGGSGYGGGSTATSGYVSYPSYSASSKQKLAGDRGVAQGFRTGGFSSSSQQQRAGGGLGTIADNYGPPPRQQGASDRSEAALSWDNLPPEIRKKITETVQQNMSNRPY